jgi:hypothetical protein
MIFNHEAETITEALGFESMESPYDKVFNILSKINSQKKIITDLTQEEKVALIFVFIHTANARDMLSIIFNTTKISGAIEALSMELNPNQVQLMLGDIMVDFMKIVDENEKKLKS